MLTVSKKKLLMIMIFSSETDIETTAYEQTLKLKLKNDKCIKHSKSVSLVNVIETSACLINCFHPSYLIKCLILDNLA